MSDCTKETCVPSCEISASVKCMCIPVWVTGSPYKMLCTVAHCQNNSKPLIQNMIKIFYRAS